MAEGSDLAASIASFAVYSPDYGLTEETESEKLLFYYPEDADMDRKLRHVGLCEAMVNFTLQFSPTKPCEYVHTQQHRMIFLNPEGNFWLVLVRLFTDHELYCDSPTPQQVRLPVKRGGAGREDEYGELEVHNSVLQAMLRQTYRMFKLYHGSFAGIVKKTNVGVLREKLASFFADYLPRMDPDEADLLSALDGIHFLPLDKSLYLRVQSVINYTEQAFPDISYTCFFYTHHLVWSGLEQDDIRVLYRSLNTALAPAQGRREEEGPSSMRTKRAQQVFGRQDAFFVMGADNFNEREAAVNPQRVFVGADSTEHHLIIFQLGDVTMVFLLAVTPSAQAKVYDTSYYKALNNHLRPHLTDLNMQIGRQQRKTMPESPYRYIYFNHMNLALKATVGDTRGTTLKDAMKLLTDMHEDFERAGEGMSEMCVRTMSDVWVVGRRSDQREFYVIISKKDASLIEINEEVRKLCSTQFSNIFLD